MSLIVAKAFTDRVELVSDAGMFDATGKLLAIQSKLWASSNARVLCSGRGDMNHVYAYALEIMLQGERAKSFDGTIAAMEKALATVFPFGLPFFEIVIAGISETNGPTILGFASVKMGHVVPLQMIDLGGFAYAGPDASQAAMEALRNADTIEAHLLHEARTTAGAPIGNPRASGFIGVGGRLERATMGKDGLRLEVLRTWPDRIGQPVTA
jgi:hypothetical protein